MGKKRSLLFCWVARHPGGASHVTSSSSQSSKGNPTAGFCPSPVPTVMLCQDQWCQDLAAAGNLPEVRGLRRWKTLAQGCWRASAVPLPNPHPARMESWDHSSVTSVVAQVHLELQDNEPCSFLQVSPNVTAPN